jgi:hypothetical protein
MDGEAMSITDKLVMATLAIAVAAIVALIPRAPSDPCGVAEFAPDVPQRIKEQCREQRRIKT